MAEATHWHRLPVNDPATSNPTEYIVVFKDNVSDADVERHADDIAANGGEINQRYGTVLKGFAATIPESYFSSFQSLNADVISYIEPDGIVTTQ
ncbi:hypothetical protein C8Q80DRAFT_1182246 [Daedaleopsis nitida]|nr:hypothetical protein C8Q80DRAFT_1182246 [Daedaleopsis nitida]